MTPIHLSVSVKDLIRVEKYKNSNSQLIYLLCEALNTTDEKAENLLIT